MSENYEAHKTWITALKLEAAINGQELDTPLVRATWIKVEDAATKNEKERILSVLRGWLDGVDKAAEEGAKGAATEASILLEIIAELEAEK